MDDNAGSIGFAVPASATDTGATDIAASAELSERPGELTVEAQDSKEILQVEMAGSISCGSGLCIVSGSYFAHVATSKNVWRRPPAFGRFSAVLPPSA